ncbi:MAG: hypothetical protein WC109_04060 [Syntrophomonadaceae bacterium]|nr:hypothetical protein [Syntrophomonadaceae bacterium]MDD4562539.1 hypothetical protein [Syntrophomonadaceae bacterium]
MKMVYSVGMSEDLVRDLSQYMLDRVSSIKSEELEEIVTTESTSEKRRELDAKLYFPDGELAYKGSFIKDKRNGEGTLYWPGQVIQYTGDFREDQPDGKGTNSRKPLLKTVDIGNRKCYIKNNCISGYGRRKYSYYCKHVVTL